MVEFKRRRKVQSAPAEPAKRWAIVDDAAGVVENVIKASDSWVETFRAENPGKSIVPGDECGGVGWAHAAGRFVEPVNPKGKRDEA
jgi:hypothetical protein